MAPIWLNGESSLINPGSLTQVGRSGSSRFESLILSHHSRFTCECNKEEINDDNDDGRGQGFQVRVSGSGFPG